MPKVKLDAAFAATAQCFPGRGKTDWTDSAITGFVLEVRESGGKTYYLKYRDQTDRLRQHKIGRYQDISFAVAKQAALKLRSKVVMGGDPRAEKEAAKAIPFYREVAAAYLQQAKLHHRSFETNAGYLRNHVLPRWGNVRLTEIRSQAVAQWLADKRAGGLAPATVEKIRVIFGRSFVVGHQAGLPGCDPSPVRSVPRVKFNNARERYLTAEEADRLRAAAAESYNIQLRPIVDLLLFTGARVGELLKARWEHIDLERRAWFIPTTKTNRPRHVPLSSDAMAVIQSLPRFEGCPWLLPNPKNLKPFVTIQHGWERAIRVARLPGLRIHDLRHSAASFMVNAGIDVFAVGKVLGHASYQSTQRYAHLANDTLLAAVEAGAAKQKLT